MQGHALFRAAPWGEVLKDPSLTLAMGTAILLTVFLGTVHACCFGLASPEIATLLQICSSAG